MVGIVASTDTEISRSSHRLLRGRRFLGNLGFWLNFSFRHLISLKRGRDFFVMGEFGIRIVSRGGEENDSLEVTKN